MNDIVAILGLAGVAALWAVVQLVAARSDHRDPGVRRDCGGVCHGCDEACDD